MNIKKIVLVLMAINIFVYCLFANPSESSAAVSKVASKAAKEVAKDAVVDIAVNMAEDIIFHYQMDNWLSGKYDVDDGYKAVCLDEKKDSNKVCKKPAQVKEIKTDSDKKKLKTKVEEVLDRKTNMSGWKKFVDWFVPVFLVSGVVSWISAKLDSETNDLFDSIAEESLQELNYVKPVTIKDNQVVTGEDGKPLEYPQTTPVELTTPVHTVPDVSIAQEVKFVNTGATTSTFTMPVEPVLQSSSYIHLQRNLFNGDPLFSTNRLGVSLTGSPNLNYEFFYDSGALKMLWTNPNRSTASSNFGYTQQYPRIDVLVNGVYKTGDSSTSGFDTVNFGTSLGLNLTEVSSVMVFPTISTIGAYTKRPGDKVISGDYYLQKLVRVSTITGVTYDFYITSRNYSTGNVPSVGNVSKLTYNENHSTMQKTQLALKMHIFTNVSNVTLTEYTPTIEDFPKDLPVKKRGTTTVAPPSSVPIKTPTGVEVKPSPDGTGWVKADDGTAIEIDEDDLTTGEVDPTKVPTPRPKPEGTKTPTDEGTGDKENNLKCEKGFKDIEFGKVGDSFTHAFPFSIPWDIKRWVDNALGGVGDEKPEFELSFLGDGVVLTVPEFFDRWVPFAKSLVVIGFDIGLIFLFYRFMKGGGD